MVSQSCEVKKTYKSDGDHTAGVEDAERDEHSRACHPTDVERFVERFALLLAEAGLGRMPARVFGALLVTEDGKLTAGELPTPFG